MKTKKEILELRSKLYKLKRDLDSLYNYHKPTSKFFGLVNKGDLNMAMTFSSYRQSMGNGINLIDWILDEDTFLDYVRYNYDCLREATDDWLKEAKIPKEVKFKTKSGRIVTFKSRR